MFKERFIIFQVGDLGGGLEEQEISSEDIDPMRFFNSTDLSNIFKNENGSFNAVEFTEFVYDNGIKEYLAKKLNNGYEFTGLKNIGKKPGQKIIFIWAKDGESFEEIPAIFLKYKSEFRRDLEAYEKKKEVLKRKKTINHELGNIIVRLRTEGFYSGTVAGKYNFRKFKRIFLKSDLGKEIVAILSSTNANEYTISLIKEISYFLESKKGPFIINKIIKFSPSQRLIDEGFDSISYNLYDFDFYNFNYNKVVEETIAEEITDPDEDICESFNICNVEDPYNRFKNLRDNGMVMLRETNFDNEIIDSQRGELRSLIFSMEDDYPELKELSVNDSTPMDFTVDIEDYIVEYQEGYHQDKTDEEFRSDLWNKTEEYYKEYNMKYEQTDIDHDVFKKYTEMTAFSLSLLGAKYGINLD